MGTVSELCASSFQAFLCPTVRPGPPAAGESFFLVWIENVLSGICAQISRITRCSWVWKKCLKMKHYCCYRSFLLVLCCSERRGVQDWHKVLSVFSCLGDFQLGYQDTEHSVACVCVCVCVTFLCTYMSQCVCVCVRWWARFENMTHTHHGLVQDPPLQWVLHRVT